MILSKNILKTRILEKLHLNKKRFKLQKKGKNKEQLEIEIKEIDNNELWEQRKKLQKK